MSKKPFRLLNSETRAAIKEDLPWQEETWEPEGPAETGAAPIVTLERVRLRLAVMDEIRRQVDIDAVAC